MLGFKKITALAVTAIALTACQTQSSYRSTAPTAGFEGQWLDQNGILSTFYNGEFQTKTTDGTNTLLAVGSYTQVSPTFAEIELKSLVRKTVSKVNCSLATSSRLNCTSSTGTQFTLFRKA